MDFGFQGEYISTLHTHFYKTVNTVLAEQVLWLIFLCGMCQYSVLYVSTTVKLYHNPLVDSILYALNKLK